MNITLFGATGPTGRALLPLAVRDGHKVTAVARDPSALANPPAGVSVRHGDVLDRDSLSGSVDGADAVISALGSHSGRAPTTVYSTGTAHILETMAAAGVRRLVVLSAAPLVPGDRRPTFERVVVDPILHRFFGGGYADMARMEQLLAGSEAGSDVDWTVLRPPRLTDKPGTGRYRSGVEAAVPRGWNIPRADLARAMLDALDDPGTIRTRIAVAT